MKTQLIYSAILAAAVVTLSSCGDKEETPTPAGAPPAAKDSAPEEPQVAPAPSDEELMAAVMAQLSGYSWLTPTAVKVEESVLQNGSLHMSIRLTVALSDNLYVKTSAPAEFNEERKAINDSANKAMQPESAYLLQIGAPSSMITDEERAAKPLPENLQQLADELRDLSESSAYTLNTPAGAEKEIIATLQASQGVGENAGWDISHVAIQTADLPDPSKVVAEASLPENAPVLTAEFEEARKLELQQKIEAFNEAALPYIQGREEAARASYTERQARLDEEARRTAEEAAAAAAEKEKWTQFCVSHIASGKRFSGEWTRGSRFGGVTIHITKAELFETSIQFIGTLYDTKLPQASLNISGRCELAKGEDGTSRVDIIIYDGIYDADQPTAEVYDAQDGQLTLSLDEEGRLKGVMTCASWKETPEKAFNVLLAPKEEPASNKKKGR